MGITVCLGDKGSKVSKDRQATSIKCVDPDFSCYQVSSFMTSRGLF